MNEAWLYILVMGIVTFVIRALPMLLINRPITNPFFKSFLHYVPYVTLSVMTFPAIMHATQNPVSGLAAFVIGLVAAFLRCGMFTVALICCTSVFVLELFL